MMFRGWTWSGNLSDRDSLRIPREADIDSVDVEEDPWAEPPQRRNVFTDLFGSMCLFASFVIFVIVVTPAFESLFRGLL